MLTNRLSCPSPLNRRTSMPAALDLRVFRTSPTLAPSVSTTSAPLVKLRSGDGMRTLTLIGLLRLSRFVIRGSRFVRQAGKPAPPSGLAARGAVDGRAADAGLVLQQLLEVGQLL